jgi:hypothetical protein
MYRTVGTCPLRQDMFNSYLKNEYRTVRIAHILGVQIRTMRKYACKNGGGEI